MLLNIVVLMCSPAFLAAMAFCAYRCRQMSSSSSSERTFSFIHLSVVICRDAGANERTKSRGARRVRTGRQDRNWELGEIQLKRCRLIIPQQWEPLLMCRGTKLKEMWWGDEYGMGVFRKLIFAAFASGGTLGMEKSNLHSFQSRNWLWWNVDVLKLIDNLNKMSDHTHKLKWQYYQ
jgi:hypothetical protein